ncbi:MAG: low affinity iron permease family protein [Acidimicrobiales bacterium]|jgi:low affinity Fe/Cu permease
MEHSTIPQWISRILHWIGEMTARAGVAAIVTIVVLVFAVVLAIEGFPGRWSEGFSTAATSITLVMLFVIQHTQSRQQVATQLKLDELIRTSPEADPLLVKIEKAKDEELIDREEKHIDQHESLRGSDSDDTDDDDNAVEPHC